MKTKDSPSDIFAWDPLGLVLEDYENGDLEAALEVDNSVQEGERLSAAYFYRNPKEAEALERDLLERCVGKVLDIGAGAGTHALYLQEKGLDVTALDVSKTAVDIMQKRGLLRAYHADVFTWTKGPYDTLLMLMNGIGIVGTLKGLHTFFEHAQKLLVPGGQILLESTDILYAYTDESGIIEVPGDHYYGEIMYQMHYKGQSGARYPWLYLDPATLVLYAEQAGYQCEILRQESTHNYSARLVR